MRTSDADRRIAAWLFVAGLCFFLLFASGISKSADEDSIRDLTSALIEDGSITIDARPFGAAPGRDGTVVSKYGLGQPVASIPLDLVGRVIGLPLDDPSGVREATATSLGSFATAGMLAWAYLLGRRLGARPLDAAGVAVAGGLGSMVLVYGTEYFTGPVIALLTLVAVERAVAGRWTAAYAALAFAAVTHARGYPIAGAFGLAGLALIGPRRTIRAAWPLAAGAGVVLAYAYARFGSVTGTGYEGEEFTTSPLDGTFGLLFEPSKTVFFFLPLAVVGAFCLRPLARRHRTAVALIGAVSASVVLMTVSWYGFEGGWSWGPRFFVPIALLLAVPVAPWLSADRNRWGMVAPLALLGFAASFPALVVPSTLQKDLPGERIGPEIHVQYARIPDSIRSAREGRCADALPLERFRNCAPALWQVHVGRTVGPVGDAVIVGLSAALALGTVGAGRRTFRLVRDHDRALGPDDADATDDRISDGPDRSRVAAGPQ